MTVTASTVTDSQFRIFKNESIAFVSTGENITKIVFTCTADGTEKYGPGCFAAVDGYTFEGKEGTWTGNSKTVLFTAESAQVRATKIVVTIGEGDTPGGDDNPNTQNNPLAKFNYKSGTFSESEDGNQITVDYVAVNAEAEISGKMIFDFENGLCTKCTVSALFPTEEMAKAYYDESLANKKMEGIETITIDGKTVTVTMIEGFNTLSKPVIKSMMKMLVDNEQGGLGTQDSPMTPNQVNVFAGTLDKGATFDEDVYIKGKIASIKYEFSAQYGTATFFISADGQNDFTFQCYSVYYLENKPWVEGNTQIKVGDEVIICGKVVNYNGNTPETASKKAYIYSLNGVTKNENSENPDPQPSVTTATCAEILAGTDGTVYRVTGKCVEIANTVYGNWYLEDATGKIYIYGTLDKEGNSGKNNSIDAWGIEVGDELTVEGERTTYKETVELKNVKVIEIKKGAAESGQVWDFTKWSEATIANLKAEAAKVTVEDDPDNAGKTKCTDNGAIWSDHEKTSKCDTYAASKDNCFWSVAEPNEDGELSANGVVIAELKGLKWNKTYSTARSLAIAVNYPTTSLGDYAGPAYLWLGGGKKKVPCFTIPGVKAGSTITMEVESHKPAEGRGVELYTGVDADNLVDAATKIGDTFAPTAKDAHTWTIESDCDVIVYNTNGCHIYKITVAAGDPASITTVKENSFVNAGIFNLAGQRLEKAQKGLNIINGKKVVMK